MQPLFSWGLAAVMLILCSSPGAQTPTQTPKPVPGAAARPGAAAPQMAGGEVVAVYTKDQRVLLKHGPIESLGMGPMTMEFGVTHRKLLNGLKRGHQIRFTAEQRGDDYVITRIAPAR
jgi:Cu(I)/Ag(I) efflux system periplasmic protein CusF